MFQGIFQSDPASWKPLGQTTFEGLSWMLWGHCWHVPHWGPGSVFSYTSTLRWQRQWCPTPVLVTHWAGSALGHLWMLVLCANPLLICGASRQCRPGITQLCLVLISAQNSSPIKCHMDIWLDWIDQCKDIWWVATALPVSQIYSFLKGSQQDSALSYQVFWAALGL